ncbi:MAG: nucleotide exchange factor GrpE [Pseudomonadota bacterium]
MATNQRDRRDDDFDDVVGTPQGQAPADGDGAASEPPPEEGAEVVECPGQESDIERRLRQVSSAYVELQAQMKSFQERNERLQEERDRRRRGEVVTAMFEPVQNLRRSLEAWRRQELPMEAVQGLTLVLDQFQEALAKLGLEAITAAPAPFDPNIHDAICTVPTQHAVFDGQVVQIFEAGYRVGSQVIQPARVIIGKYTEPEPEPRGEGEGEGEGETEPGAIPEAK